MITQATQTLHLRLTSRMHAIRMLIQKLYERKVSTKQQLKHHYTQVGLVRQKLDLAMQGSLRRHQQSLIEYRKLLHALNPIGILERGYSITYNTETGKPITRLQEVPATGHIKTQLTDGTFESTLGSMVQLTQEQTSLF
jgi:exodeoxyribonuclease VII large subunit